MTQSTGNVACAIHTYIHTLHSPSLNMKALQHENKSKPSIIIVRGMSISLRISALLGRFDERVGFMSF